MYPALALAEKLEADGYDVHFAGTPNGIESRIVPEAGFSFKAFDSSGFDRAHPATLAKGVSKILKSTKKAAKWFKEIQPVCVVGFGGYVSIPVARAAEKAGIPVVVHEQNSVMGMANKYISKKASAVCLTYDQASSQVPEGVKTVLTGNPVRKRLIDSTREEGRKYLSIPDDATMLLVFGGSRGARHINEAISALKGDLLEIEDLYIVHITGPNEYDDVRNALSLSPAEEERWRVVAYEDEMPKVLSAADAVVSRAGATSLAEIAAKCVPAVLVPYPYATNDHQRANAQSYALSGAAVIIDDDDLDGDTFRGEVLSIASDADRRRDMRQCAMGMGHMDAAATLAKVVEDSANDPKGSK